MSHNGYNTRMLIVRASNGDNAIMLILRAWFLFVCVCVCVCVFVCGTLNAINQNININRIE